MTKLEEMWVNYQETRTRIMNLRKMITEIPDPVVVRDEAYAEAASEHERRLQEIDRAYDESQSQIDQMQRTLVKHLRELDRFADKIKGLVGSDAAGVRGAAVDKSAEPEDADQQVRSVAAG